MSAVCLELIAFFCLLFGALSGADVEGVVRRNVGESITIQCNSRSNQESLSLKMGLNEEQDVFYTATHSSKPTINGRFADRLQYYEKFPKVEILIKNLTVNDTGPYWCVYKMTDMNFTPRTTRGSGSVLLVVTEKTPSPTLYECDPSQSDLLLLLFLVICAVVVIIILTISLIWIILKKKGITARTSREEQCLEEQTAPTPCELPAPL